MALQKEVSPIVVATVLVILAVVALAVLVRAMSPHERVLTAAPGHGFAAAEMKALQKYRHVPQGPSPTGSPASLPNRI